MKNPQITRTSVSVIIRSAQPHLTFEALTTAGLLGHSAQCGKNEPFFHITVDATLLIIKKANAEHPETNVTIAVMMSQDLFARTWKKCSASTQHPDGWIGPVRRQEFELHLSGVTVQFQAEPAIGG